MNKFQPHVLVIPEDQADEDIANGFALHESVDHRRIQVVQAAGGWPNVLAIFEEEYVPRLRNYPRGHVVMLIDFDCQGDERMARFRRAIPDDLAARVFVVGSSKDPEALRAAVQLPLEEIGRRLAAECSEAGASADAKVSLWGHEHLRHNARECERLEVVVKSFLFSGQ